MIQRPRLSDLLRAKAESSRFPAEADLFHAKADELDIDHLNDEPFQPIPDPILYMVSVFKTA